MNLKNFLNSQIINVAINVKGLNKNEKNLTIMSLLLLNEFFQRKK